MWPGFETYGIDVSPEAVFSAKEKGVNARIADARDLPFADESFGAVLMLDMLEHIEDDYKALKEAHRVLAKGGILIASVPLYPCLWSLHDEAVGHVRRYKPGQVKRLLKQEGFSVAYETRWNLLGIPGALLRKFGARIDGTSELLGPVLLAESRAAARITLPYGLSEFCVGRKED